MDFTGVKEILEAVNTSNVSYFEYETCDGHIIMDKSLTRNIGSSNENKNTNNGATLNFSGINTLTKQQISTVTSISPT